MQTYTGKGGEVVLLPRLLPERSGLVSIYIRNDGRPALQWWRSVFDRRAPQSISAVSAAGGAEIGQGTYVAAITNALLDTLFEAYCEAAATAGSTVSNPFDWAPLHELLAVLPAGRWTTYGELAKAVGTAAQPLGGHVTRCPDCPNAWRVLGAEGKPRDGFHWSHGNRTETAEAMRSVPVLGGPWAVLGLTPWNAPLLGEAAALGGVWLLGLLVVAVNVALTAVVAPSGGTRGARLLAATGAGALLGLAALGGWVALGGWARAEAVSSQVVRIALVQPGDIADPAVRLAAHAALTAEVGRTDGADLVVWGQSSVTGDPAQQPAVEGVLRRSAADAGVDVLVNGKAGNPAAPSNTSWLYTPDGARATYHKRLLVPFGEYVPLRPVLGWLEGFTPATEVDRVPGAGPVAMRSAGVTIGPLISYESAFPGLRRELARLGVDLTVVRGRSARSRAAGCTPSRPPWRRCVPWRPGVPPCSVR